MAKASDPDDQRRLEARARELWESEGRPQGREQEYLEKAREALAIEDNPLGATQPIEKSGDRILRGGGEPPEAVENQGEFPGLADQGEESPQPPKRRVGGRGKS
jgi:Protein of unknown function (DUF2934)